MGWLKYLLALMLSIGTTALGSAYMLYLRVPSVIEVRPNLAEVGFWTGLFSGRSDVYLWYHYPDVMVVLSFVLVTIPMLLWVYLEFE